MEDMRTLDAAYLSTHPEGDTKAEFTLSAEVPGSVDVKPNPDGTRPSISVKVSSETYMAALLILTQMHDDPSELYANWITSVLSAEQLEQLENTPEGEGAPQAIKDAVNAVHDDFLTIGLTATAIFADATGKEVTQEAHIDITAPSVASGLSAFDYLTSPRLLTNAAISFSPETEDDEDWGDSNEVLVR